jgi:hypothetical protein
MKLDFEYFLYVVKLAQLIRKCKFHDFYRLEQVPKNHETL